LKKIAGSTVHGWKRITKGSAVHGSMVGEKNKNQDTDEVGEP
jgi:hypothetical protein